MTCVCHGVVSKHVNLEMGKREVLGAKILEKRDSRGGDQEETEVSKRKGLNLGMVYLNFNKVTLGDSEKKPKKRENRLRGNFPSARVELHSWGGEEGKHDC